MRKRTKILVIAVVVVILALIAGLATTVLAGESGGGTDTGDNSSAPTLASKVATILGLDDSEVTDAFQQARQEMQGQAVDNLLNKAVEKGLIDQVEAAEIMEWWQNRPEALGKLGLGAGGRLCLRWGLAGNGLGETFISRVATILELDESEVVDAFQQARQEMLKAAVDNFLNKAVEKGLIDQVEAAEIMEWWQNRPEALGKLVPGACLPLRNTWRLRQQNCAGPLAGWSLPVSGATQTLVSRVAAALGLDESEVADAFQQARQEMQGQAVDKLLDKAVEKGRITQDESDQIKEWRQNRPEALSRLGLGKGFLPRNGGCQPHQGKGMGRGFGMMSPGS